MKREKAYSWLPFTWLQSAKAWEQRRMAAIITDENAFQIQDFCPEFAYELEPELRTLGRNSLGWSCKVTIITPEGIHYDYEQFVRCRECREVNLLSGGCTYCTDCQTLLEDVN